MRAIVIALITLGTAQAALADDAVPYPDGVVPCLKGSCHDGDGSPAKTATPDWRRVKTTANALVAARFHCDLCERPYRVNPLGK